MNGYDLYKKAKARLGAIGGADEILSDTRLLERALELINQIAADLKLQTVTDLTQEIVCSDTKNEALCCGTAMLLALSEGDTAKNQLYTNIYNAKRAAALGEITRVEDRLPVAEGEV